MEAIITEKTEDKMGINWFIVGSVIEESIVVMKIESLKIMDFKN